MDLVCLIVFNYFSCSAISLNSLLFRLFTTWLFILLNKYKPPRVLTHAIETVFGMGLPSRNRGLGKGRAAEEWKKNKNQKPTDTLYYTRKAMEWIRKRLHAERTGYTTRCTDHWSAQSTQLSSHPQPAQEWRLFFLLDHSLFLWQTKRMLQNTVTRSKWSSQNHLCTRWHIRRTAKFSSHNFKCSAVQLCFLCTWLSCCRFTRWSSSVTLDSCGSPLLCNIILPSSSHRRVRTTAGHMHPSRETRRERVQDQCFKA